LQDITDFWGELAALSAALIWAISAVVYAGMGRQVSPLLLNLAKGLIAIALLFLTLAWRGILFPIVSGQVLLLLILSGVVGIGLGDTAYFQALQDIGARRALVMESLAPPLSALLALLFLQEQLSSLAWLGIVLTVTGVLWVVLEQTVEQQRQYPDWVRGIGCGLVAALGQSGGVVLSRSVLANSDLDPLWSTFVRLVAGCLALVVWLIVQQGSPVKLQVLNTPRILLILVTTAFFSTYVGIWLQQVSLKYTAAGISQSLSATSPLFVLPIAALMGDRVSLRAVFGVIIALAGVWLLFSRL
jgi:drug/metabolite transporter (DMT)-like permease